MDIALLLITGMDKNTIREYQEYFNGYCAEILSIYNKKTNQEDYTNVKRYQVDNSGKGFNQYIKDNHQILDAIDKLKTAYRFALSRW